MDWTFIIVSLIKIVFLTFLVILPLVNFTVYIERRQSALTQDRVGPNRVGLPLTLFGFKKDIQLFGIGGLLQGAADGIKFILKEDFTPKSVNAFYFWLAPLLTLVPALLTCAVLPFGSEITLFGVTTKSVIADLSMGPVFVFAIASLGVYGIVLAGWASNSKYPFLGAVRSSSQMISYEMSMGLSIIPVLMVYREMNLTSIAAFQDAHGWLLLPLWGEGLSLSRWVLLIPMSLSFVIFTISMFAETNRLPFDLPECETELVAGYHTEYSSMKFALFFLGEYAAMIVGSGVCATLFLGGWSIPFGGFGLEILQYKAGETGLVASLAHIGCFFAKVLLFLMFFVQVRWSLPRFRFDQLMKLGWLVFFELAIVNIILTAVLLYFFPLA